jgi:hypothetical protein
MVLSSASLASVSDARRVAIRVRDGVDPGPRAASGNGGRAARRGRIPSWSAGCFANVRSSGSSTALRTRGLTLVEVDGRFSEARYARVLFIRPQLN